MSDPVTMSAQVSTETEAALTGIATSDLEVLTALGLIQEAEREASGLDPRTFALVKIAALIALGAPPASYLWQVANAVGNGVSAEDIVGVLQAVAPQVGLPKVVAAAPEIMVSLGLTLPGEPQVPTQRRQG
jgi:alkylhydroperoxidase/carboxymuconolactone decarboxylase family protein YurZ